MKTIGIARLGRNAELKYRPGGEAVANLSLAFNFGKKDDSGNRPTQWIDASFWGKRAESLSIFLVKGIQLYVEIDDVHLQEYRNLDGSPGAKMVGRISNIEMIANKANVDPNPSKAVVRGNFDDMTDDIPF